jgi:hypothetical protein
VTGILAWLALAACLLAIPAGRALGRRITHALTAAREDRARWAAFDAQRHVVDRWRAELAAEQATRAARSAERAATAAPALRPFAFRVGDRP